MNVDERARRAVDDLLDATSGTATDALADLHERRRRGTALRVAGAVAVVALVVGGIVLGVGPADRRSQPIEPVEPEPRFANGALLGFSWQPKDPITILTGELHGAAEPTRAPRPPRGFNTVELSADGTRLEYYVGDQLLSVDLASGERRVVWQCRNRGQMLCSGVPALSPDGREVAIVRGFGDPRLDLVDLATGESRKLYDGTSAGPPAWSADGNRLALATPEGIHVLERGDGWTPQLVGTRTGSSSGPDYLWRRPSWSPDGTRLAYVEPTPGTNGDLATFRLVVTDLRTGDADPIHDLGACVCRSAAPPQVEWSPDGRLLAATTTTPGAPLDATGAVLLMRPDGTEVERLTVNRNFSALLWQPVDPDVFR